MYQVFVDGQELDIDSGQVIAVTLQASGIGEGELLYRKAGYTNSFSVPKTHNNIQIFEAANLIKSTSTVPYTQKGVKVLDSGIEIFSGTVSLEEFDVEFKLQLYADPKTVTTLIGDKVLSDLDFGDIAINWDAAYWDSRRAATTGFVAPVIDYGQIDRLAANGDIGPYYLPSVAYKDIITTIFLNAGYTLFGDFYDNDVYFNNMALTYSRKTWLGFTTFKLNEVLSSEIKQIDFVRDFLIKFGAYLRVIGDTIEIITLEEILNTTPVDKGWEKNKKIERLQYALRGWAQSNNFLYPNEQPTGGDDIYSDNGSLDIPNFNIDVSREVYTSIVHGNGYIPKVGSGGFNGYGVITWSIGGVPATAAGATTPAWNAIPTSYTLDEETQPMLVLLRDHTGGEPASIIYNGNVRTDYKVGMFFGAGFNGLQWTGNNIAGTLDGLLEIYYETFQKILNGGLKVVQREYKIPQIDIQTLDLLVPIYDDGDVFLILSVNEFVSGRLTRLTLLKLGY